MRVKNYLRQTVLVKTCFVVLSLISMYACTDEFAEINTNKSQLQSVGPKELAGLFSRSQTEGVSWFTTDNYSRISSTITNHLSGYTACGNYPYEENQIRTGWHNTGFNSIYSSAFPALKSIMEVSKTTNTAAYHVALIWKVYLFHMVTDMWGPIPYTEAGNGKESIPYESQRDVYYKMFADLDQASKALTTELTKTPSLNVFGLGDMIFNGDVAKWLKFSNTLRLRLAVRLSNIDPDKARQEAEAAVTGPLMESAADDALMAVNKWSSGGNGIPRMESFYQDVMSSSMESYLVGYRDPRLQEFFAPVAYHSTMDAAGYPQQFKDNIGGYHGMAHGFEPIYVNYFRAHSNYGPRFKDGKQLVTPINIMHSAETYFLKAEGAWRGWNMGGSAKDLYEKGIEVSIKQWRGTAISADSIQRYVTSALTPIAPKNYPYNDPAVSGIPVKFSTNTATQFEQIITQKWIALFPLSVEAWAEQRRTRLPKIYAKKYSVNANVDPTKGQIITRLPFTDDEKNTQPEEIKKAIQLLGGADLENTPLWWDTHSNK